MFCCISSFICNFGGKLMGYIFYLQVIKFPYNIGLQLLLCTWKIFRLAPQYNINLANENRFRNMTNVFSSQTLSETKSQETEATSTYDVKYMLKSLKDHFILECWLCHLKLVKWVFMNLASRVKLNQRRFWTQDKMH